MRLRKTNQLRSALLGDQKMSSKDTQTGMRPERASTAIPTLLTPEEAKTRLKVSLSWLAKARMRGDGPPYIRVGRSIRYAEVALIQWMKSRQRLSTSEL
jgi:Helix-turn-helix domain